MDYTWGHETEKWNRALEVLRSELIERAKSQRPPMTYDDAFRLVRSISHFRDAGDITLWYLIGAISGDENARGAPALGALVVNSETHMPGSGFYSLQAEFGRTGADDVETWVDELKRVHRFWSDPKNRP
jgi:hypothetical protein